MASPNVCTTNTLENTDYGIPITAYHSTDYRTTTGTHHRYMPPQPQDYVINVKRQTQRSDSDVGYQTYKNTYRTSYAKEYYFKQSNNDPREFQPRAQSLSKVSFTELEQKRMDRSMLVSFTPLVSTMKDSFVHHQDVPFNRREVYAPVVSTQCDIQALGRDEQPPLRPEEKGYMRHLDPYQSTTQATYVPYSQAVQDGLSRKDIITFYDTSGTPKGGRGFGPKYPCRVGPLVPQRKPPFLSRIVPAQTKAVPNFGLKSEYQDLYVTQSFSDLMALIHENGVVYETLMFPASAWQNLSAPGMYCTEQCHIGSAWPVRAMIAPKNPGEAIPRKLPPVPCKPDTQ